MDGIRLITADELAKAMGFSGATNSFREWLVLTGIKPVPGRRGFFDPVHVRRRLDAMHMDSPALHSHPPVPPALSLVEQRRARLGKA